jgi:hypothetical protein
MDINNFGPFRADVWGSFSDWVMVGVTSLTAIYLIKTFRSQKKVQLLQQSITDIENERYRIEYLPKFEITTVNIVNATIETGIRSTVHFKLKLEKNEAKELTVTGKQGIGVIQTVSLSIKHVGQHMPIPVVYPATEYDLHFTVLPNTVLFQNEGCYFFFSLTFTDSIGNKYEQLSSTTFKDVFLNFSPGYTGRVIAP